MQIDPETQVFCAKDLSQGYQQVPLAEEHTDLTPFNLPWSSFCYECLPMGLKPSGDQFNIESENCTKQQVGCLKPVDDCLQQAKSYCQLKDMLVDFLGTSDKRT